MELGQGLLVLRIQGKELSAVPVTALQALAPCALHFPALWHSQFLLLAKPDSLLSPPACPQSWSSEPQERSLPVQECLPSLLPSLLLAN